MTINTAHDAIGDVDALRRLERFSGFKLREELTTLFLHEAPSRLTAARAALAGGDVQVVRDVAHMLKSSAGQIGAVRMQHLCERIEDHGISLDLSLALADLDLELTRYTAWLGTAPLA